MVVVGNIPLNFLAGCPRIRIIAHQIDFLLFETAVKAFRDRIVCGPADPGKREVRFELAKELLDHPRRIRRPPIHP